MRRQVITGIYVSEIFPFDIKSAVTRESDQFCCLYEENVDPWLNVESPIMRKEIITFHVRIISLCYEMCRNVRI